MNIFNSVSAKIPKRHKFNLSHQAKLTGEMGELLPIMCEPVLPGDRFKLGTSQLIRFAPLTAPIMSDIDCYVHFFFVPNRIIWSDWETFITASRKGKKLDDSDVPVPPRLVIPHTLFNTVPTDLTNSDGKKLGSICTLPDYLGFPTVPKNYQSSRNSADLELDELPLRAYQRIFFDWYRDENLSSFDDFDVLDNDDYNNGDNDYRNNPSRSNLLLKLQRRAWKKDYFTSALPFAQKGDEVIIPGTGGSSDLSLKGSFPLKRVTADADYVFDSNVGTSKSAQFFNAGQNTVLGYAQGSGSNAVRINPSNFKVDVEFDGNSSTVSEGTIRELRRAMAAQKFLEREAVGGTRYIEQILAFFGVKSSDARMQRSEFLGGSKQPVVISQVLQTSGAQMDNGEVVEGGTPLGQPAGNAVSAGGKYIFDRTFEEHGWIVGVMSIIPRAEYMGGMPRKYMKRDRFDYYWPQFARIGEQPIYRQELQFDFYNDQNNTVNGNYFGYTPRYAEYRFINSHIHGDFKESLNFWTLARDYGDVVPLLNESFIECRPSTRIYAYENSDFNHVWIQVGFNISALRPLPKYGESI